MARNPRKPKTPPPAAKPKSLPSGAHALAAIGPKTEAVVDELYAEGNELFNRIDQAELKKLGNALDAERGWSDEQASLVVRRYAEDVQVNPGIDASSVARWALAHPNNSGAVFNCLSVVPPEGFSIIRVLSQAGSQKTVFLASWRLALKQVVLKRVTGPTKDTIIDREAQVHPLSMRNRNIIETHVFQNVNGEKFLVEERLPVVLNDSWRSQGIQEAANLLYDVANALVFLHDLNFVHGDIKPDNIGKKTDDYILLDFGIGRAADKFTAEVTGTGSLRTRAPELLATDRYEHPKAADVWALGATVYNSLVGRFPLFEAGENPPRITNPSERSIFEEMLRSRVDKKWDQLVEFSRVPEPLRKILQKALTKDPTTRMTANQLSQAAAADLSGFLRATTHLGRFSALDEVDQLSRYLPKGNSLRLMPVAEREALQNRLNDLRDAQGLTETDRDRVRQLMTAIA